MKKLFAAAIFTATALLLAGCLTVNQKDILPVPYELEVRADAASPSTLHLFTRGPVDWDEVDGVYALKLSHGLGYNEEDCSAYFQLASDNESLFVRATVKDDHHLASDADPASAWDYDSVEVYVGRDTRRHTSYDRTDHRIRVNQKSDGSGQLGLDDLLVRNADVAYETTDDGYIVTFSVPFSYLGWTAPLEDGMRIRAEYALNDNDGASREMKLQWAGDDDLAYSDPSKWGDVTVEEH